MIWRSTLVFLTSLTALTIPVESLRAEGTPLLIAQSSTAAPSTEINPNNATPRGGNEPIPQNGTAVQQPAEIKAVQQELKKLGYYNGPIDGIYGPNTAAAIRALRGQTGDQPLPPGLLSPTPAATTEAAADEAAPPDTETEAINIGEQVSPTTGVDTSDPATGDGGDVVAAPPSPPSPGLGRLLWPGLALIAALGSFGIGFILSNRLTQGSDEQEESPWGTVPDAVPQPQPPQSSLNGQMATTNGAAVSQAVIHPPHQGENGLARVPTEDTVSTTTRLAKVDVIDELVSGLQVPDPTQRRKAIWELGQRGNSSAVPHLVNGMVDADSKEKSLILAALSEIGIRSLKPMNRALAIALQDENPDVRKNAIRDLTRVYDLVTQISQMLGHATEDEDPEVRRTAEWALGQLNRIREAPQLKSSINTLESSRTPSELLPDEVENLKN